MKEERWGRHFGMILGAFPAVMGHTSVRRFFFLCRVHISMMRFGCLYKKEFVWPVQNVSQICVK